MRRIFFLYLLLVLCFPASSLAEAPVFLTEETFPADDLPADYLTPVEHCGHVERVRYTTTDDEPQVKSAMVYLPADYDEQRETRYNVLYLLHASSGKPKNYLDPEKATDFQCLLDHMIENGEFDPLIVVAATYYPSDGFVQFLPLAEQVKLFEKEVIMKKLRQYNGVKETVARDLGLSRATLYRKLAELDIN